MQKLCICWTYQGHCHNVAHDAFLQYCNEVVELWQHNLSRFLGKQPAGLSWLQNLLVDRVHCTAVPTDRCVSSLCHQLHGDLACTSQSTICNVCRKNMPDKLERHFVDHGHGSQQVAAVDRLGQGCCSMLQQVASTLSICRPLGFGILPTKIGQKENLFHRHVLSHEMKSWNMCSIGLLNGEKVLVIMGLLASGPTTLNVWVRLAYWL